MVCVIFSCKLTIIVCGRIKLAKPDIVSCLFVTDLGHLR